MDDKRTDKQTRDILKETSPVYQTRPVGSYTIEDYLALPDDIRAELIDGKLFYMEAPSALHQYFLTELTVALHLFIHKEKRRCSVLFAPLDVQLDCDDKTMIQPDIVVICDRNKLGKKRVVGAPAFCIEVTSPSTRSHDMKTKLRKYKEAGVKEYWIVDIDRRQVICYFFEDSATPALYSFDAPVPVRIFGNKLKIDFSEILDSFLDNSLPEESADMIRESVSTYHVDSACSYTIDDYLALPDDIRAELIDGKLFYMEAPSALHQEFLFKTAFALETYIRNNHGSCKIMIAPLDVQLDCDNKTMVQPDIMVICTRDKITKKRIYGAPDFCIEILSPSTRNHDMKLKLSKYQDAGVKEYWMVDPDRRLAICYFFESESAPVIYSFDTPVPVQIFSCNLNIDFAKIESTFSE